MRGMLVRVAEGRSAGIFGWYGKAHAKLCPNCGATYKALLALRAALHSVGQVDVAHHLLPPERWETIESACRD